jgi:hypothetical protein
MDSKQSFKIFFTITASPLGMIVGVDPRKDWKRQLGQLTGWQLSIYHVAGTGFG